MLLVLSVIGYGWRGMSFSCNKSYSICFFLFRIIYDLFKVIGKNVEVFFGG